MRSFREEAQFTLRELASLLDVSHHLVAMDEKGRRFLPGAAEKKLEMLQETWKAVQKNSDRQAAPLPEELKAAGYAIAEKMQGAANKIEKELKRLEQKLQDHRERYQYLQQRLAFLRAGSIKFETDTIAEPLALLAKSTISSMKRCCPAVQQLLELEHKTLAFKHKELVKLINRLSA